MLLKKLGWWDELTDDEKKEAEGKNWKTDLSGGIQRVVMKNHGCHPFGNAKARAVVWNFPDRRAAAPRAAVSARPGPGREVPDPRRRQGVLAPADAVQDRCRRRYKNVGKKFPLILTSGRLVEYEGGGEETRSNPWLAELQQDIFVEINPKAANDRSIRNGDYVWVKTPTGAKLKVKALVTERVGAGHLLHPVPLLRLVAGQGHAALLPGRRRADRARRGGQHGHDLRLRPVTMMQETKTTVCNVAKA